MINGEDLVRYFSEIEDERYYSDYEIEDLYERAFSEGYEYAQKEFASARQELEFLEAIGAGKQAKEGLKMLRHEKAKTIAEGRKQINAQRFAPEKFTDIQDKLNSMGGKQAYVDAFRGKLGKEAEAAELYRRGSDGEITKFISGSGRLSQVHRGDIKDAIKSGEFSPKDFKKSISRET